MLEIYFDKTISTRDIPVYCFVFHFTNIVLFQSFLKKILNQNPRDIQDPGICKNLSLISF